MVSDKYRLRRARRGFASRRLELLGKLWMAENMLTHAIIGHMAGDPKGEAKKTEARAEIATIESELNTICHPEKP